ncbi:MAG: DUF423 domain-containing protein [Gemmatimonadetes bacterium]|nr:DUF423 domain-containing protein [Gemmatimonadota bacterium]
MARTFWALGAVFGFLGVAAGAFGAHALRARVEPGLLAVFETAVRYQMYHALGLFAVALLLGRAPSRAARAAGWLFTGGILVFSGSLYLLVLSGVRWLGAITPIGGVAFLAGWLLLGRAGWRAFSLPPRAERPH